MNTETNAPAPEWAVKCAEELESAFAIGKFDDRPFHEFKMADTADIAAIIARHAPDNYPDILAGLVEYVRHSPTCLADNGRECSCGLSELLSRFNCNRAPQDK